MPLVDGWETRIGAAETGEMFITGRTAACRGLARVLEVENEGVAGAAATWASAHPGRARPLPRAMRPLVILAGMAGRRLGVPGLTRAVRLGLLGS